MTPLLFLAFLLATIALVVFGLLRYRGAPFPLTLLVGAQTFRIVVEVFLHELAQEGIIPKMLTWSGANFDIFVGASAPIMAWLVARGKVGRGVVIGWNVTGLVILANVVVRAILSSPALRVLDTEVPNMMFKTFPYMFVPAFFVPLAVALHVLALRAAVASRTPSTS